MCLSMRRLLGLAFLLACLMPQLCPAAAKKYQVTGTVVSLTDTVVTVQKPDGDKWELDRDPKAVVKGDLKVGEKVTIQYTMTASAVEVKSAK